MSIGIYGIRNIAYEIWYIGQSMNLERRRRCHFSMLRNNNHYNKLLQSDFLRLGANNFVFYILEICEEKDLDLNEKTWMINLRSNVRGLGYNINTSGNKNKRMSEESKRKMSESKKGIVISDETKSKIRKMITGRHHSDETRRKISMIRKGTKNKYKGVPRSEETKAKMSKTINSKPRSKAQIDQFRVMKESCKGRKRSAEFMEKWRKTRKRHPDGKFI